MTPEDSSSVVGTIRSLGGSVRDYISAGLGVHPGERVLVAALFLHSALIGSILIFTLTSANALFLSFVGPQGLPLIYLTVAIVGPLTSGCHLWFANRYSNRQAWRLSLLLISLGFLFLRSLMATDAALAAAFGLLIWYRVVEGLLNLEFWGLSASLLDVRQAKRLYGVIGSGEVLALVVGGFGLPVLVARLGSENLVLLSAAAAALCLPVVEFILRADRRHRQRSDPQQQGDRPQRSQPLGSSYTRLILALFLASVLMRFLVDKSFLVAAHARFNDADAVAAFLGTFYAVAASTTLGLRSFATGSVLNRWGLGIGLLVLPLSLGLTSLASVAATGLGLPTLVVFGALALSKFFDRVLRLSIDRSSVLLLFQPFASRDRVRIQTFAEGIISPVGAGLAGVLLLCLDRFSPDGVTALACLMLAVAGVWLVLARLLSRQYPRALAMALQRRQLTGGAFQASDPATLAILRKTALGPQVGSAVYALDLLEDADPAFLKTQLPALLRHPAPELRCHALGLLERTGILPDLGALRSIADADPIPEVRAAAIRVLAVQDSERNPARLAVDLRSPHPAVRTAVLVGLLRHGDTTGRRNGWLMLRRLLRSADPGQRADGVQVLGQIGHRGLYRPLQSFLLDPDVRVRRAALEAAGAIAHPRLWPAVAESLGDPACAVQARRSLLAAGDAGVDALIVQLERAPTGSEEERRILRLLGTLRSPCAIASLLDRSRSEDPAIRHAAQSSLAGCRYHADESARPEVEAQLLREVRHGAWLLSAIAEFGHDLHEVLPMALANELERTRDRLLLLLGFLESDSVLRQARLRYWTGSPRERAIALELLDSILTPVLKSLTFPFLERLAPPAALRELPEEVRPRPLPAHERLLEILEARRGLSSDSWTRACALYCAARRPDVSFHDAVTDAIGSGNPVIAETALLASWSLNPSDIGQYSTRIAHHDHPRVRDLLDRMSDHKTLMNGSVTIERVILLKGVSIFASTPSDVLLQLANALDEVQLSAGETLFERGELGTSMYVIIDGLVRVHVGEQTIVELGDHEIVGELAALDPEPRSASVTAIRPTRLYRIEQETLLDLMMDQPEIIQGVIRELAKRIRQTTAREAA